LATAVSGVDLSIMTAKELVRLYGSILGELRERKIVTTNDGPIGGYGESLVARGLGGQRQRNSKAGFDVLLPDGIRLQVKTSRPATGGPGSGDEEITMANRRGDAK